MLLETNPNLNYVGEYQNVEQDAFSRAYLAVRRHMDNRVSWRMNTLMVR
jgi:hypothetical protein